MTYRQATTYHFTCDGCGQSGHTEKSSQVPENWYAFGISAGLGKGGGHSPDGNSTVCPTIRESLHFCSKICYQDWVTKTLVRDLLNDADDDEKWGRKS